MFRKKLFFTSFASYLPFLLKNIRTVIFSQIFKHVFLSQIFLFSLMFRIQKSWRTKTKQSSSFASQIFFFFFFSFRIPILILCCILYKNLYWILNSLFVFNHEFLIFFFVQNFLSLYLHFSLNFWAFFSFFFYVLSVFLCFLFFNAKKCSWNKFTMFVRFLRVFHIRLESEIVEKWDRETGQKRQSKT